MDSLFKKLDSYLFGIGFYYLLALILTFSPYGSVMNDDSLSWIIDFKENGWSGFWNSYGMNSLYFFHDILAYIFNKIAGKSNFGWYALILFFHSTATYFYYLFLKELFVFAKRDYARWIAWISSMIFLVGAYHEEIIYWAATFHYAVSNFFFFISLYFLAKSQGNLPRLQYIFIVIGFMIFLTMHEIVYFFPFAYALVIIYYNYEKLTKKALFQKIFKFEFPFIIIAILSLLLNYQIHHVFVPHYGSDHLEISLYTFFYKGFEYFIKHIFFIHNGDFAIREKFYDISDRTMAIVFGILIIILIWILVKYKNRLNQYKDYLLILSMMLLMYIPIGSMYFYWHYTFQNNRLGYFISLFIYAFFTLVVINKFKKRGIILMSIFFIVNFVFFRINITKVQEAINFTDNIFTPSYQPYLKKTPYILNLPYNYHGVYQFREPYRLMNSNLYHYNQYTNFVYIASMGFSQSSDSVEAKFIDKNRLKVELKAPGSWFMKETIGASDWSNDSLDVKFNNSNQEMIVTFKKRDTTQPILYVTGNKGFVELK